MVEVELVETPSQTVATVRTRVPLGELPAFFGGAFEQVMRAVPEAGGTITGPPFGWYHGMPTDTVDVSAGFPVTAGVPVGDGPVGVEERPGGQAAVAVHIGSYEAIEATYAAVMSWLAERALEPREDMWEEYLSPPTDDPATWRTRIVMPVR